MPAVVQNGADAIASGSEPPARAGCLGPANGIGRCARDPQCNQLVIGFATEPALVPWLADNRAAVRSRSSFRKLRNGLASNG